MNGLLKINVPQFIFLALSYIFAQNKPLFTYFSSIFLKIVLKIIVRLSLSARNKPSRTFIFSKTLIKLLKINLDERLFVA